VTRGSWLPGVVVLLLLIGAGAVDSEVMDASSLYINGELVSFSSTAAIDGVLYVPIDEASPYLGAEWSVVSDEGGLLRWNGGLRSVAVESLEIIEQAACIPLLELVDWTGGDTYRIGDEFHVTTSPVLLSEVEASDEAFVLRFSGFAPQHTVSEVSDAIVLRFANCELDMVPRTIVLPGGPFTSVRIGRDGSACRVTLYLRTPGELQVERLLTPNTYSLTLGVGDVARRITTTGVSAGITLTEAETVIAGVSARVITTTIAGWRALYRLVPAVDALDSQASGPLAEWLDEARGVVAVGWTAESGLVVIDGMPIRAGADDVWALGADLFGRLSAFAPQIVWTLSLGGRTVPVTGVNRPIAYDELIVYSPGYVGAISSGGIPGTFTVIKVRDEQVVSIYRGGFTIGDPTATVIVASGEMKAYLAGILLGDRIRIRCSLDAEGTDYRHAAGVEGVLAIDGAWALSGDATYESAAWSIVTTDWLGTLSLITITGTQDEAFSSSDIADYLAQAVVGIKDAWVLSTSEPLIQAIHTESTDCTFGPSEPISTALCLIPVHK